MRRAGPPGVEASRVARLSNRVDLIVTSSAVMRTARGDVQVSYGHRSSHGGARTDLDSRDEQVPAPDRGDADDHQKGNAKQ